MKKQMITLLLLTLPLALWAEGDGSHFRLTLGEAGTLKQRLNAAVMQTDYDLVDSLTIKGKLGGADLSYLQGQEGFVSQLQYLDITEVELVADGVAYASRTEAPEAGLGMRYNYSYYVGTVCHDERVSSTLMAAGYACYRNDLSMAFYQHTTLQEVRLPRSLPGIGERMFMRDHYEQSPLCRVVMPESPAYIGAYAFYSDGEAAPLVDFALPATVDNIGEYAFRGRALGNVSLKHVRTLSNNCFERASIEALQWGTAIEEIPREAFANCTMSDVAIPATVKSIGLNAFNGSTLTKATIASEKIGDYAFRYCTNLTSVELAEGVKRVGEGAFDGCWNLAQIDIPSTVEEVGYVAFGSTPWSREVQAEADHIVYIGRVAYETRDMDGVKSLTVKDGTVSIADNFYSNSNPDRALTSISLPASLRIIGESAFEYHNFATVDLPEGLEKIGARAFARCEKLRRITIPASVHFIGREAFDNSGLLRLYYNAVEAETGSDDEYYFFSVFPESLMRAELGEGVRTIPNCLFYKCKNMTRLVMPSTVESIGIRALWGCGSLSKVDLPTGLHYLGEAAFAGTAVPTIVSYVRQPFEISRSYFVDGEEYAIESPFEGFGYDGVKHMLQVPHGTRSLYEAEASWADYFDAIEEFGVPSDAETVNETATVSISEAVTDDTDLTGTLVDNIFVTLDTEDSGDGYNTTEGCIIINSTTTDEGLAAATADNADDLTVKNQFNGLIFEVPEGKGSIVIDCQTLGKQAVYVKIGSSKPQEATTTGRQQLTVPYVVGQPTRIYVYAAKGTTANAASKTNAARSAAYANDDAVKLYGLTINVDENLSGIDSPTADTIISADKWYTLDGCRLTNKPQQKGVYIKGGHKVVVK